MIRDTYSLYVTGVHLPTAWYHEPQFNSRKALYSNQTLQALADHEASPLDVPGVRSVAWIVSTTLSHVMNGSHPRQPESRL